MRELGILVLRWPLLLLLIFMSGCGGAQAPVEPEPEPEPAAIPDPVFEPGTVPATELWPISGGQVVAQEFTAEFESLAQIQVLVASGQEAPSAPIQVEIRSKDFRVRYAKGTTNRRSQAALVPEWARVSVEHLAPLKPMTDYVLVLFSEAPAGDWWAAIGEGSLYPFGNMTNRGGSRSDLGFRLHYTSGDQVESPMAQPTKPLDTHQNSSAKSWPYGLHQFPGSGGRGYVHLPQCTGALCADFTTQLYPEARVREKLAETFDACSDEPFATFRMRDPVIGISCRDVCRTKGYATCVHTLKIEPDTCEIQQARLGCDSTVSQNWEPKTVGCLCTNEPKAKALAAEDVESMVGKSYVLDGQNRPQLKPKAQPFGITCNQVCEVLAQEASKDHRDGQRLVTPWRTRCGRCGNDPPISRSVGFQANTVGDKITGKWRGKNYLIDPLKKTVTRIKNGPKIHRTRGRYVVSTEKTVRIITDTYTGKSFRRSRSNRCQVFATASDQVFEKCGQRRDWVLTDLLSKKKYKPPSGEFNFVSFKNNLFTVTIGRETRIWRVGQDSWGFPPVEFSKFEMNWATSVVLDTLYKDDPDSELFRDGLYWHHNSFNRVWAYEPKTRRFMRWSQVKYDLDLRGREVRAGNAILDRKTLSFWQLPHTARSAWVGDVGVSKACPSGQKCEQLPAPLEHVFIFTFLPGQPGSTEILPEFITVEAP